MKDKFYDVWNRLRSVNRFQGWLYPGIAALVLFVLVVLDGTRGSLLIPKVVPAAAPHSYRIELKAPDFADSGKFYLVGTGGLDREYIEAHLSVFPKAGLSIEQWGDDHVYIRFYGDRLTSHVVTLALPGGQQQLMWELGGKQDDAFAVTLVKSTVAPGESVYLQFSHPVDRDWLMSNLEISPRISYDVRCTGLAAELVLHSQDITAEARYTIRVAGSLSSMDGRSLGEAKQFDILVRKQEEKTVKYELQMTNGQVRIASADKPVTLEFNVEAAKTLPDVPAVITMYRMDSFEKYLSQSAAIASYQLDPADLYDRVSTDIHVLTPGASMIDLDNPGLGVYVLKIEYENPATKEKATLVKPLMVTDISLYMQSVNAETLFWANSSATGQPLSGYTIEILDDAGKEIKFSGKTDQNGVLVVDTTDNAVDYYDYRRSTLRLLNPNGETVYIDMTDSVTWNNRAEGKRYFSYLYLDRSIYKPTDAVSFWGFVKPHAGNDEPQPREVIVMLDREGLGLSLPVSVDAYGVFHGELPLEQVRSGNYMLETTIPLAEPIPATAYAPERTTFQLDYEYIEVKQFQKPTFVIDCVSDKELYNFDEQVQLEVRPTFYDGTVLPNFELELTTFDSKYGSVVDTQTFMTDDEGLGRISFPAYPRTVTHVPWRPMGCRYQVRIVSDGENVVFNGNYTFMPTDTMLVGEIAEDDDGAPVLRVETNKIAELASMTPEQYDALMAMRSYYYYGAHGYNDEEYGFLRGAAVDCEVVADISMRYRSDNGTYYSEEHKAKYTLNTKGGAASVPVELPERMDKSRGFYINVTYTVVDKNKRNVQYTASYSSYKYEYYLREENESKVLQAFTFAVTRANGESALGDYYAYQNYNEVSFGDGETMTLSLLFNGEPVDNKGRILYTVLQDKTIETGFTSSRELRFTQSMKWADNVNIVASYFDGRHVFTIRDTLVSFREDSTKLNVEITPGQEKYMPGETASVAVRVTDQNGRGVAGSACVSVVDEAVFALREQNVDTLSRLHSGLWFYNYNVRKYTTLKSQGIAENGARGDIGKDNVENIAFYDMYRKNFKDTAAFIPVRTNASGYAYITFPLPDNTTSWRVTSVAIGDNLYAGNNKTNFASSLLFFINPVVSQKYIAGDEIAMLAQAHGSLLDKDSEIAYSVRVQGDRVDLVETATGKAYERRLFRFGKLPEGEYKMIATARYGGFSDTVELPFAVVSSNLELVINRELDLSKPLDVNAVRYPVTISFYDKEYSAYYRSLSSLLKHYCMIANQRMSRFVAKRALSKNMEPEDIPQYIAVGNDEAGDMQNPDGGIGWNVGGESDTLLTTQVLLIAKDQFNLSTMAQYYHRVLQKQGEHVMATGEEIASSYLGLAYIGEDVKEPVLALLGKDTTPILEKAYLIAALAYGGNTQEALAQYKKHITPIFETNGRTGFVQGTAESQAGDKWQREYENKYATDRLTKTAWLAASRLALPDADEIAMYFAESNWRIDSLFECMAYVTGYDKTVTPSGFAYSVNGEARTAELGITGQKTISLNKSEFESFQIESVPQNISATAYFIGEPGEADFTQSEKVKVDKSVVTVDPEKGRYRVDLTITLAEDAPLGDYDVSDWIPSNARFYDIDRSYYKRTDRHWYYHYATEGQKLRFTFYNWREGNRTMTVSYFIQKAYDTEAVMDSTYVIHGNSGESAYTQRCMWID